MATELVAPAARDAHPLTDPSLADLTPFMRQWTAAKRENPDALLFFRMGDFYELFYDDAVTVSRELQLTLTARDRERSQPMCGVPYHAVEGYLARLLRKGYRIAICDQMEDPEAHQEDRAPRGDARALAGNRAGQRRWGRSRTTFWRRCFESGSAKERVAATGAAGCFDGRVSDCGVSWARRRGSRRWTRC